MITRATSPTGLLVALSSALVSYADAAPVLPAGFNDTLVAAVTSPTAIASAPDGRLLITTQTGQLRIVQNGSLVGTPALDLSSRICSDSERGLLGAAVDPAFGGTGFIYLFYTFNKSGSCERNTPRSPVNRVSRFVLSTSNFVDPVTETILIDNIPSPNGNHNAGDLHLGRDGYLYVSVGDAAAIMRGTVDAEARTMRRAINIRSSERFFASKALLHQRCRPEHLGRNRQRRPWRRLRLEH